MEKFENEDFIKERREVPVGKNSYSMSANI